MGKLGCVRRMATSDRMVYTQTGFNKWICHDTERY